MATKLPRGIIQAKYKLADGVTTVLKFRVRINRKKQNFRADEYFDDLNEAKEFLKNSRSVKGREIIWGITEEQRTKKVTELDTTNYRFDFFIKLYKERHLPEREDFTELERRNWNNKMSFLKTIENTSIPYRYITHEEKLEAGIDSETDKVVYKKLGYFDVRKIGYIDINNYVVERTKTVSKLTVLREITSISNVWGKLHYFNDTLEKLAKDNPTFLYDKSLTAGAIKKRTYTYNESDQKLLFQILGNVENKTYYNVAMICLLTGLRRSEGILLKKSQIEGNQLTIEFSKNKFRKVYLTPEAQQFIETLPVLNKDNDRYFKLTVGGYEKMYRSYFNTPELKHLQRSHDLRRTNISRLITSIGLENSVVLTQILGIQNVASFEKNWNHKLVQKAPTTQKEAMSVMGHGYAQVTKGYFNFNIADIKYTIKNKE